MQLSLNTLTALAAANQSDAQVAITQWLESIYQFDARVFYHRNTDTLEVLPRERITSHGE
jgi:hypothetical protein